MPILASEKKIIFCKPGLFVLSTRYNGILISFVVNKLTFHKKKIIALYYMYLLALIIFSLILWIGRYKDYISKPKIFFYKDGLTLSYQWKLTWPIKRMELNHTKANQPVRVNSKEMTSFAGGCPCGVMVKAMELRNRRTRVRTPVALLQFTFGQLPLGKV